MTRIEATARWGISRSTLIRAEGTVLTPVRGSDGEISYAVAELEALAAKKRRRANNDPSAIPGESIAEIFDALEGGASRADVVRRFRLHPDLVDLIAERWRRMGATTLTLSQRDVGRLLEELGIEEAPRVDTLADLLAVATDHRKATAMRLLRGLDAAAPATDVDGAPSALLAAVVGRLEKEFRKELMSDQEFAAFVASEAADCFADSSALDDGVLFVWDRALRRLRAAHRRKIEGLPTDEQSARTTGRASK